MIDAAKAGSGAWRRWRTRRPAAAQAGGLWRAVDAWCRRHGLSLPLLRQRPRLAAAAFDGQRDPAVVFDAAGRILYANLAY